MTYSSLKVQIQKEKRKFHQGIRKEETESGSLCEGINR